MGELDRRLMELGEALELPTAPDFASSLAGRLPARHAGRARRPRAPAARRTLAIVVASLLLAGGAMATTPIRHEVLRLLGLRGARIERVSRLPVVPGGAGHAAALGVPVPIREAHGAIGFSPLIPAGVSTGYVAHDVPGARLSLLVGQQLIVEFRGLVNPYEEKIIGPGTRMRLITVNGGPGVWITGAPHEVVFRDANGEIRPDRVRLSGNVLLWQQGPITVRVEGAPTLTRALELARSLR